MTDLIPPEDDRPAPPDAPVRGASRSGDAHVRGTPSTGDSREDARRIAAAHTAASRDVEALLRRLPAAPDPADLAEYAALLAREEALRVDRRAAAAAAGLDLPSVGGG